MGPDRVIVRRAHARLDTSGDDLLGVAALIWLALDEPATFEELERRLAEADVDVSNQPVTDSIDQLIDAGWVERHDAGSGGA